MFSCKVWGSCSLKSEVVVNFKGIEKAFLSSTSEIHIFLCEAWS